MPTNPYQNSFLTISRTTLAAHPWATQASWLRRTLCLTDTMLLGQTTPSAPTTPAWSGTWTPWKFTLDSITRVLYRAIRAMLRQAISTSSEDDLSWNTGVVNSIVWYTFDGTINPAGYQHIINHKITQKKNYYHYSKNTKRSKKSPCISLVPAVVDVPVYAAPKYTLYVCLFLTLPFLQYMCFYLYKIS